MTNAINFKKTGVTAEGDTIIANISLDDDCKNGHIDFSITGSVYEQGKPQTDRYCIVSGAISDTIAVALPEMANICALHLCDMKGAPMYASGNGFYHLRNTDKDATMKYLRISDVEYDTLYLYAEDQDYMCYLLERMGVIDRWEDEAKAAIKQIEEMSGQKIEDNSVRYQYTRLTDEQIASFDQKIEWGYNTPAAIATRKEQAQTDAKAKAIKAIREDMDKTIEEAKSEYHCKLAVIEAGLPLRSMLYYKHSNTLCFNWNSSPEKITTEQFDHFCATVDKSALPAGITFEKK